MILSDQNRQTLLIELHRLIAEQSINMVTTIMEHPDDDRSIYPPDTSLNEDELQALCDLDHNPDLSNALNKVFKDFTAKVLFRFFNIIDQTRVPDQRSGDWSPITLADLPEGYNQKLEYLHDHFLETYWDWKELYQQQKQRVP
jgi:hypothetical protein